MGAIIYKGEYYGGNNVIEITQADYDALSSEQKNNGTLYVIKDAPSIIDIIYPVGSIYISVNNVNPGTYLTGTTWEAFGTGKTLVGVDTAQTEFNTVQKTGGEKNHQLSVSELPSYNLGFIACPVPGMHAQWANDGIQASSRERGSKSNIVTNTGISVQSTPQYGWNITSRGSNTPHNNLQPYITCYMWKRIH